MHACSPAPVGTLACSFNRMRQSLWHMQGLRLTDMGGGWVAAAGEWDGARTALLLRSKFCREWGLFSNALGC